MSTVTVRPMTQPEFDRWQDTLAEDFAAEQVAIGRWAEDGAVQRARDTNAELLPDGLSTPRMLILMALDADGEPIGRAWVSLDHPRGAPDTGFLYDIEIIDERRGEGLGRGLLRAVEDAVLRSGVHALELNVFGSNRAALALYDSSGYAVTTQQMRKPLGG